MSVERFTRPEYQRKRPPIQALQITSTNQKAVKTFCGSDTWMLRIAKVCEGAWLVRMLSTGALCIDSDKGFKLLYEPIPDGFTSRRSDDLWNEREAS